MLKATEIKITERPISAIAHRDYEAKPRVYVFPANESVLENLDRRHSRPHSVYRTDVLPQVKSALEEKFGPLAGLEFSWSQKAGCSCGCSPGFIIKNGSYACHNPRKFDVFVTVEDDMLDPQTGRTGRGPNGKLRNFKQMSPKKFADVYETVIDEDNDDEALEALHAEAARRLGMA